MSVIFSQPIWGPIRTLNRFITAISTPSQAIPRGKENIIQLRWVHSRLPT